jgi:hypothetical protein
MHDDLRRERIRTLNDEARAYLTDGIVRVTDGVAALPPKEQAAIIEKVCTFSDFTPENDPHGEHDFGTFEHNGRKLCWKIDYYDDNELRFHSPEPSTALGKTKRVLTVMLAKDH